MKFHDACTDFCNELIHGARLLTFINAARSFSFYLFSCVYICRRELVRLAIHNTQRRICSGEYKKVSCSPSLIRLTLRQRVYRYVSIQYIMHKLLWTHGTVRESCGTRRHRLSKYILHSKKSLEFFLKLKSFGWHLFIVLFIL